MAKLSVKKLPQIKKIPLKKIPLPKNLYLKISVLSVAGLLILFFAFFGIYSAAYAKKIYRNQYVGDLNFSGKNKAQAEALLKQKSDQLTAGNVTVTVKNVEKNNQFQVNLKDLALSYDNAATVQQLWSYGRGGGILSDFKEQLTSFLGRHNHPAKFILNDNALKTSEKKIADTVDIPEKNYDISYDGNNFVLSGEQKSGRRIDQNELDNMLIGRLQRLDSSGVNIEVKDYTPRVTSENAQNRLKEANKIVSLGNLVFTSGAQQFQAQPADIAGFLSFTPDGDDMKIGFNADRIKLFADSVARAVNVEPQNAKLAYSNNLVVVTAPSQIGKSLDEDKMIILLQNALLDRINAQKAEAAIALPIAEKQPDITNDIASSGFTDLVGTATTDFVKSPTNRVHNITIGANSLNGILVKAGDEFSTLAHLGTIDASSGYLQELVIKENTTVPDYGGGLCQVSSTLFRATLNAGLKITARQNHSYRVSYYEPPIGMDATIYDPAPDFKFVNNYDSPILIQSSISGTKITFQIFGKKDSRIVSMTQPVTSNPVDPGPPVYVETDTLPAGVKKQTDHAHQGLTAQFDYTVTKDGKTLQQKTFVSKYVPWTEKWLVGKGTVAPTCSDGAQNGDETGVDCGGTCPTACPS